MDVDAHNRITRGERVLSYKKSRLARANKSQRRAIDALTAALQSFDPVFQPHRRRESRHYVIGCGVLRTRSHYPACRTTADRMAAHRKSDRRRPRYPALMLRNP